MSSSEAGSPGGCSANAADDWFGSVTPRRRRKYRVVRQELPPADDWFDATMPPKPPPEPTEEEKRQRWLEMTEDAPF